jgi:hypothetical protein
VRNVGYNAQVYLKNSAREWILDAGGSASGVDSSGAFFIHDNTANAARLLIDHSGNVGIGSTAPGSALDVKGNRTVAFEPASAIFPRHLAPRWCARRPRASAKSCG